MRPIIHALMAGSVVAACAVVAGPAWASPETVCPKNCQFTSIQAAINAASNGDTITIGPGKYSENVVVDKQVTLQGSGDGTVIYPAVSNPVCSGGSLCGGTASNIILVQADNVTITNMRLEGDNPALESGVVIGGADIDARNGIITNHLAGTFSNLTVSKVKISDVYLRGIYASSGGTFNFNNNTIDNVQADPASIAMFNFGGSGVMADNKVTNANDAISANWSMGTQFLGNDVSKSGSGVHTDNNGGFGGVADLIQDNTVHDCKVDGYGVFVFAPYRSATVDSNTVMGCYVGLAAFGSQVSGQGPTFSNNDVKGSGAKTTDPTGTYGAYLTTDLLGFGFGDLNATLTGNLLEHFGTGMFVTQTSPTPGQPVGGQATVTASNNSFHDNKTGANGDTGTAVDAENNWWGCKQGPNTGGGCDTAIGTVDFTPWLTKKP
jgi:Right handed beta helix region